MKFLKFTISGAPVHKRAITFALPCTLLHASFYLPPYLRHGSLFLPEERTGFMQFTGKEIGSVPLNSDINTHNCRPSPAYLTLSFYTTCMKAKQAHIATQTISGMLMLLFGYTAISKLAEHAVFYAQLQQFPWLAPATGFISWAVPLAEITVVTLLFFPATARYGLYASGALLAVFTLYLLAMVLLKTSLPCSCGGVIARLSWRQHTVFNVFFMALAIAGIRLHRKRDLK